MKKLLSSKTVQVFEEVFWKPGNRGCIAEAQDAGCRTHMTRLGRKSLPSGGLVLGNIMGNFPSPETYNLFTSSAESRDCILCFGSF